MISRKTQIFIVIYAALIAGVAVVAYMQWKNNPAGPAANEQANHEAEQQPADETASWKTYADSKAGFSLKYPDTVFRLQTMRQNLPGSPARIATPTLVHSIQMEHCDLSGVCVPTTEDITVGFIVVDKPLDKATAENTAYGEFEDKRVGDVNTKVTVGQAEGEGIYFYFIALPNNKTLVILRSFIDEHAILSYQTAEADSKGFIKVVDQEKLFEKIMGTFKYEFSIGKVLNTAGWKTYTNLHFGVSLMYPQNWEVVPVGEGHPQASIEFNPKGEKYYLEGGPPPVGIIRLVAYEDLKFDPAEYRNLGTISVGGKTGYINYNPVYDELSINFEIDGHLFWVVNDIDATGAGSKHPEYNQIFNTLVSTLKFTK